MSMTLEEAIARCEKIVKEAKKSYEVPVGDFMAEVGMQLTKKGVEEYQQYVEWLRELQERRKQPEIIRCYECVHASDIVPILNPNLRHCDKCGFFKSKDYFCGDAERRTDDKTNKGSSC